MATRLEIANGLKKAACSYLLRKGFACHLEIGITRRGRFKVDVLAVSLRGELIVGEVKSCAQDFTSDNAKGKWLSYLPACHKLYFIFTQDTADALVQHFSRFKELGCGVLVLCENTGYLKCLLPAKYRPMLGKTRREIITRLAWRSGEVSKRTSRRVRVFLKDTISENNTQHRNTKG